MTTYSWMFSIFYSCMILHGQTTHELWRKGQLSWKILLVSNDTGPRYSLRLNQCLIHLYYMPWFPSSHFYKKTLQFQSIDRTLMGNQSPKTYVIYFSNERDNFRNERKTLRQIPCWQELMFISLHFPHLYDEGREPHK